MRIMNLIKNYPTIVITIIILLSGISGILIQSKVYASTEKANTPGCGCLELTCTTVPRITPSCYTKNGNCECGFKSFNVCEKNKESRCKKIYGGGCGDCKESDCTIPNKCNPGCGNCTTTYVYGCSKPHPYCGECCYELL